MKLESIDEVATLRQHRAVTLRLRQAARAGTIGDFSIWSEGARHDVCSIISADPLRAAIIVECEDRLADIDEKLARLGVRVNDPFKKADRDADGWRRQAEMYGRAWLRELGGTVYPKAHFIDALVLTTERMRKKAGSIAAEREAIAQEARRYASHYPEASDGRNTFVMLAEWIEARETQKENA